MSDHARTPQVLPEGVRTLDAASSRCPVCREAPLQGRQTFCSAACRRAWSRQREAEARRARDEEIRALLRAALRKLEEGTP